MSFEALGGRKCYVDRCSAGEVESVEAPFRILADFREAIDGWQFACVPDCQDSARVWTAPVEYRYLEMADYALEGLPLYFVRYEARDFLAALRHWPLSVAQDHAELRELEECGASCLVVIEGDAETLDEILVTCELAEQSDALASHSIDHGIPWMLAHSQRTAEIVVFEIMLRAWRHVRGQEPLSAD
jgi:hypothetical protein